MHEFTVRAVSARRTDDPVLAAQGVERHVITVPVKEYPVGMPLDPNARVPNINRRIYQEVEASLLNREGEPGTFHLKHKGVVIVADSVKKAGDDNTFKITLRDGDGILDGGHTDQLLRDHIEAGDLPEAQYIDLRVFTKVPQKLIPELSRGLNTSVQVQPFALANLGKKFDNIKAVIGKQPYADKIAWRENDGGDYDARDIISLMYLFNIELFPNDGDEQPIAGYEKKSEVLRQFEGDPTSFEKLLPILPDILELHDIIRYESGKHWNEAGGIFGSLAYVEGRKRGEYEGTFSDRAAKFRLMNGALYPMLASFRWMVEPVDKAFGWRGGFDSVVKLWSGGAAELMRLTHTASKELGYNPNAIGKSRNHWANLHARVGMRDLLAERKAA